MEHCVVHSYYISAAQHANAGALDLLVISVTGHALQMSANLWLTS